METKNLGKALGLIMIVPLSFIIGSWVLTNPTGAISGLSKLITIACAFIALTNPRLGLTLLIPQVIYTDEIKRLAVSYGAVSYSTVYEVLLAPIITVICLNAGYFAAVIFGRAKLTKGWIAFYFLILAISSLIFATAEGSVPSRAQLVLNTGVYMTLIPLMAAYINDAEKARKFLLLQAWWALPSALWGIQQYYFGLNSLELDYARSGLSAVHYGQVFHFASPRPFGFFGSNSGFSSVALFGSIALIYLLYQPKGRIMNFFLLAIYLWAIYASKQRTVLLIIPLVVFTAFFFRYRLMTKLYYFMAIVVFGLAVLKSDTLLDRGIQEVNARIASNTAWGREVLSVGTFSDRLRGWTRLKKASTYSMFGTREKSFNEGGVVNLTASNYNHDVINKILIETGVAGLLAVGGIGLYCLIKLHGFIFRVRQPLVRRELSMLLATMFMVVGLSLTAGSILSTNPINLVVWSMAGAFLVIARASIPQMEPEPAVSPRPLPFRGPRPGMSGLPQV